VADADGLRAVHLPVRDKEFAYPAPRFDVALEAVEQDQDAVDVVVHARTLVRDLLLQPDRLAPGASADRGLVTLLPGERTRIRVRGAGGTSVSEVRAALFCVEPA
jgi:beta-mannosidase